MLDIFSKKNVDCVLKQHWSTLLQA